MSEALNKPALKIPDRMRGKLQRYQRKIWTVKLIEASCAAVFGLLVSYLAVLVLDRFYDTPAVVRAAILIVGSIGWALWLPWMFHRWVWKSRRLEQVARMLKTKHPRLGDYLLGIIELVNNRSFEGTSESLCRAALEQADRETAERDFSDAVPRPKHIGWAMVAAVPLVLAMLAIVILPAVGGNAFQRWLMPWSDVDRFTFTRIEPLPDTMVVPLAEETQLDARLAEGNRWRPDTGAVLVGGHRFESSVKTPSKENQNDPDFEFRVPPLSTPADVHVRIGDVRETVKLNPQPRPELSAMSATIVLPEYLQRTEPVRKDIRGGSLTMLVGSDVSLIATASRELASATVDGASAEIDGATISTRPGVLNESKVLELQWRDALGLTAKTPMNLKLRCAEDEAPSLTCRDMQQQRVIMVKDVLTFEVDAEDDYGIRTVGMEWSGTPADTSAAAAAVGEKVVFAGNPEAETVDSVTATFSPERDGIEPQTIDLRLYAEDYRPGRERAYSPVYKVFVLSEDEHAIWMTRRLDDWFKQSLETYEQEQQLYKRNLQIRNMDAAELDRPETRRKIQTQATAEEAQARRMSALTTAGASLVKEAARNDQFGVDHLEKLAEMIQSLKDIEENRMPSVADLLKQASKAEAGQGGKPKAGGKQSNAKPTDDAKPSQGDSKPKDGKESEGTPSKSKSSDSPKTSVTDSPENPGKKGSPGSDDDKEEEKKDSKVPSISMQESNMNPEDEKKKPPGGPPKPARLTLPKVTVAALPDDDEDAAASCPAESKMQEATDTQEDLLAEFQKVAEELQKLIGDLEGSTFVKRLKAMSRRELVVAKDVNQSTLSGFGENQRKLKQATIDRTKLLAKRQKAHSQTLQTIEDDLDAYVNRIQQVKFKTVLAEMRKIEVVKQMQTVAERMTANEPGTSIAHAEMLADTFDRWAEQLVGPG